MHHFTKAIHLQLVRELELVLELGRVLLVLQQLAEFDMI